MLLHNNKLVKCCDLREGIEVGIIFLTKHFEKLEQFQQQKEQGNMVINECLRLMLIVLVSLKVKDLLCLKCLGYMKQKLEPCFPQIKIDYIEQYLKTKEAHN